MMHYPIHLQSYLVVSNDATIDGTDTYIAL